MDRIYAVVVTFNGKKWLNDCFISLLNSTLPINIIAIDNASTDGTSGLLRKMFPSVEIIQSKSNLGFGRANNIGIKKAYENGADYIFLLNHDARVQISTIEKLIAAHKKQPEYGLLSPIHLNEKGDELDSGFSHYISQENCKNLYTDVLIGKGIDKIYEVPFVNAASWLLTRKCVSIVGGFNPSFYHYGEDVNFIDRLKYFGLKLGVYPKCYIYHFRKSKIINPKFDSDAEIFRRQLILDVSNPNLEITFSSVINKMYKQLLFSLITLQISKLKKVITEISIINKIDMNYVLENRKQSMYKGLSFLEQAH